DDHETAVGRRFDGARKESSRIGRTEIEVLCPLISGELLHLLWGAWAPTQPVEHDADAVRLGTAAADTFKKHLRCRVPVARAARVPGPQRQSTAHPLPP